MKDQIQQTFDRYLALGNTYEQEGNLILAYVCFDYASKLSEDKETSTLLQNYLKVLEQRMGDRVRIRIDFVEGILKLVREQRYEEAHAIVKHAIGYGHVSWIDSDAAILFVWVELCQAEKAAGESSNLQRLQTMDEIRTYYYLLKYRIYRLEYLPEENWDDSKRTWMQENNITYSALSSFIERYSCDKRKVYTHIRSLLRETGSFETLQKYWEDEQKYQEDQGKSWNPQRSQKNIDNRIRTRQLQESKKQVEFILCVNNDLKYKECLNYIEHLEIPEGVMVKVTPIYHANGIASAYNQAMKQSDAQIKVYLHQDAFIINQYFLYDILNIFAMDEKIGLIGLAGCRKMNVNPMWWACEPEDDYREIIQDTILTAENISRNKVEQEYLEVEAIDGVVMVTSKDVVWREDLFTGWHHYDVSQSMEMHRSGYKVVLPKQENVWCIHDTIYNRILGEDYKESGSVFLKEYGAELGTWNKNSTVSCK